MILSDQLNGPVLAEMSRDWMIMIVLQNSELQVAHLRHVDLIVKME